MWMAIIYFFVLAFIYGLGYYLNSRTKVPEGCEQYHESCASCYEASCLMSAHYRKENQENA